MTLLADLARSLRTRQGLAGRPLRIGYARVFHEACAHSPVLTERASFERFHVLRGEALVRASSLRGSELAAFMPHAELTGFRQAAALAGEVECVPLVSAMAVPSGPLSAACFAWLRDELRAALADAGDLDGVYLALHGSMQVDGLAGAPEQVLITDARALQPGARLAVSYDLHANFTAGLIDGCDVVTAFRSNPHWDLAPTGYRAGNRLIRALRGHVQPVHAWRKLPMVLGGGTTITALSPMRQVFQFAKSLERDPRVLAANIFMVHPFTTAAELGWAVHVTTSGDQALAERLVDQLADRVWETRKDKLPRRFTADEAVAEARATRGQGFGPITFIDEGDIVGAGAPGGNTQLIAALTAAPELIAYVPVHDPALLRELWDLAPGTARQVVVRGTDGYQMPPVTLDAVIGARTEDGLGRRIRVDAGGLRLAITDGSALPIHPSYWKPLGLAARDADVLVQKNFFHYRMFHLTTSWRHLLVASRGATSLDHVLGGTYRVPVEPMTSLEDWRAGDAAMRLGQGGAPPPPLAPAADGPGARRPVATA
jgi:microcystin degradation protein MlrC